MTLRSISVTTYWLVVIVSPSLILLVSSYNQYILIEITRNVPNHHKYFEVSLIHFKFYSMFKIGDKIFITLTANIKSLQICKLRQITNTNAISDTEYWCHSPKLLIVSWDGISIIRYDEMSSHHEMIYFFSIKKFSLREK